MVRRLILAVTWLCLGLSLAAVSPRTVADGSPSGGAERPRVGLVLSGGGARGGAQIGVLKALEELRVPVDLIAGTSIGAVIGGLYASGMSAADLEDALDGVDWDAAFLNVTPRQLRTFRRKRDDDLFMVGQRPGLGDDGHFMLPIGLVQGQIIDLILTRWMVPVASVRHFDDLGIPYRAVAADISTGQAVVLESGNLARAMRASMSLPAALSPVEIGDQLLVDGGIAMNLPVEVAQGLGADVIIAVDITADLLERDAVQSVLDVSLQLSNLLTREAIESQLELLDEDDLLLRPSFPKELGSATFARMDESIPIGYELVMEKRERFEHLSVDEETYAAYRARLRRQREAEPPVVNFIRLNNHAVLADRVVQARLHDVVIGSPLDIDVVERAVHRVYGLEHYQNVRYDVVADNGQTGLEVELRERSWGPNYLQLGVQFSAAGDENVLFGLAASYLRTAMNELGGEWRTTAVIGDEPVLATDFYQPMGHAGRYFLAPALSLKSNQLSIFEDEHVVGRLQLREGELELAGGRELGSWGEIRAGARAAYGENHLTVGVSSLLPRESFRRGELFARFHVDTLDSFAFPRAGVLARAEWRGSRRGMFSADDDYDQFLLNVAHARTWGRHTLLSTVRYEVTANGESPLSRLPRIGGFLDLSGFNQRELAGQHVSRLGASYYRRIGNFALFPAFAGISLEVGNAWDSRSDMDFDTARLGGSLWAGVNTPIGPIHVGYGRAEGQQDAFYMFLGGVF